MNKIRAIVIREFQKTVLTKAFIIGTFVLPIVMWIGFPIILTMSKEVIPPFKGSILMLDPTGEVYDEMVVAFEKERSANRLTEQKEAVQELIEEARKDPEKALQKVAENEALSRDATDIDIQVELASLTNSWDSLKQQVSQGDYIALVEIDPALTQSYSKTDQVSEESEKDTSVQLFFNSNTRHSHVKILKDKISAAVIQVRANRFGQEVSALKRIIQRPRFQTKELDASGEESRDRSGLKHVLPVLFMVLLWIATFTSGQYILGATLEEKSSRVIEVLLSAVSPLQLLIGRVLGQAMVSLVILVMYGGVGIAFALAFASMDLIKISHLIFFALYFVVAYGVFACVMACIGSVVNDMIEAQTLMMPVMLIFMMAPFLSLIPVHQDPNGTFATIASFIPPLTPFVMIIRIPATEVPVWQIGLSLVIGYASLCLSFWVASKIFRIGILMRGKAPTYRQLIQWLKYS